MLFARASQNGIYNKNGYGITYSTPFPPPPQLVSRCASHPGPWHSPRLGHLKDGVLPGAQSPFRYRHME
ncbi:hypothetical protein BD311DRAFT_752103 [Dichomitus squalens]|uniref:Uncharacterized protein n=1 Tax=Dichomitus squalens TaxID=114155 RepID=A0A4Q9MUI5_9APHY|nr:hypothetical protein BD311DRAFT_752103 [Dichomitus squalens]TBU64429.1 hypothetical protein BD310DRAFT_914631 [Dichomitus squalens]